MSHPVAIVGAGIAGLSLAFELVERHQAEVIVLERAARAGGNLRTESVDGFLCEWGPNGFLDNTPETLELVEALGLTPRLVRSDDRARRRFIYRGRRLHEVPGGPLQFATSPLLSVGARLRVLGEPFASGRPAGDETIHAFAARRIGREAADVLIDSMVSGVFGGNARELSLRACFPKMWQMETDHGGLVRAMLAKRRARREPSAPMGSPVGRLTSFAGGVTDLIGALEASLGDRIQRNAPVVGIERHDARASWRLHLENGHVVDAAAVVLSNGAAASAPVVQSHDAELASALRSIPSAPLAVVCLGYDERQLQRPLDGFGFLVPRGEQVRILGALWDSSIYPWRAPSGKVLIRVMLGGAHDPSVVAREPAELVALARADLLTTMGLDAAPVFTRAFRHALGIPQYTVGHLDRLARIDAALARHPGLFVSGNSYRGVAINSCIAEARTLAPRIHASIPHART